MIHIATAHWRSDRWIEIQSRYLERHTRKPYRVYACLRGVAERHGSRFFFVSDRRDADPREQTTAGNLDFLARVIADSAADDEPVVFLDGDAFPIADYVSAIRERLASYPLIAVRRDENLGDPQPSSAFCATTIGFWNAIGGTWASGEWTGPHGRRRRDVGGELLHILERRGLEWDPLLRSNKRDLHPLWFGVYANLVYHHGAGFRNPLSRVDASMAPPRYLAPLRLLRLRQLAKRNQRLSEEVYERIERGEDVFAELI
jgi:hypothetical protein